MKNLRRLLPYLARHRRGFLNGGLALAWTAAFGVASPWVLRYAIDDLARTLARDKLWAYAAILLLLVALEGLGRYTARRVLIGLSREIEFELRDDLFRHLLRLPAAFFHTTRVGDVMSRAVSDLQAVRMVLGPGIMYTASTVATFVVTLALMLRLSPLLSLLVLVPLMLVSYFVRHFGRRIHDRFEAVQEQLAELSAMVQENLAGARVVRAYVQEAHEERRFAAASQAYLENNRRLIRLNGALHPGIQLLMGLSAVLVVALGGRLVIEGRLTLGEFVAFSTYLAMLHWPMIALGWVLNIFERGEASMGRLNELFDAPTEADGGLPSGELRGHLRARGLDFRYPGSERLVLQGLDFDVPAGSTVAIVGPTGAGKSTLVALLARLIEPPPGSLSMDGRDLREVPLRDLRAAIGMVPQESFLFSVSLRANLALGTEDERDPRVAAAARLAQLESDVEGFPKGYDTLVGERGLTLSGGQRQRAALARALARSPRLLILDDALSAVDTVTEARILAGLAAVRGERTTLIVAQRLSSVKHADQILVLADGQLVERGTHEELLAQRGRYADMYRRQLLERELESAELGAPA